MPCVGTRDAAKSTSMPSTVRNHLVQNANGAKVEKTSSSCSHPVHNIKLLNNDLCSVH